ncbi:hypothetical protein L596_000124 [Steinernema carpocapsae]|uniref:EGF-like domain-containing protein n=1 Tax=Steinernema carpocapsae TaxID=34508 RepID=A0A4U8UJC1_STECR|nr:hypothetical protein L596_000124 [Steinernema carpocapsae]
MTKLLLLLAFVVALSTSAVLPQRNLDANENLAENVVTTQAVWKECDNSICGINAACFIIDRKHECFCLSGYTGNPWKKCVQSGTGRK